MFSGLTDLKSSSMEINRNRDALLEILMKFYGLGIPLTYQE